MRKEYRRREEKSREEKEVKVSKVMLEVSLPMAEALMGMRPALEQMICKIGLIVVKAMLTDEAERSAGPKHSKDPERECNWWGERGGYVYMHGQKFDIQVPRIREKGGGEKALKSYASFQDPKAMENPVLAKMLCGVSTRNYERVIEELLESYGIGKSSVSRHFVAATAKQVEQFMQRRLEDLDVRAIYMDGVSFDESLFVVALGIDRGGRKHILGLWQGATENGTVVGELLDDLERRGLDMGARYLFVIDGSKALRSALRRKFGERAVVVRCREHKKRNVLEHLDKKYHADALRRLNAGWGMEGYDDALKSLKTTVKWLELLNPSAARSLEEGLEETLTLHRLGISGPLRKTLATTNPIESCFSVVKNLTRRVKHWRDGKMAERWAVAGLLWAEKKFRRIKGYQDIPLMLEKMNRYLDERSLAA